MTVDEHTINAYAALTPGITVKPFQYQALPLGDHDVEIAVSHRGVCATDLHRIDGNHGVDTHYPLVPGHEVVGKISAVGSGVKNIRVGYRVGVASIAFLPRHTVNPKQHLDGISGGFADFVRVHSSTVFQIPDAIPSDVAAPLFCAGAAVYKPLKEYTKPGQRVGIVGVGGLGHLAIEFALALDTIPVAFSHSPNKEEPARWLGAEDFVLLDDPVAVETAVGTIDVLLVTCVARAQPWDLYVSFLKPRGTLVPVGLPFGIV